MLYTSFVQNFRPICLDVVLLISLMYYIFR